MPCRDHAEEARLRSAERADRAFDEIMARLAAERARYSDPEDMPEWEADELMGLARRMEHALPQERPMPRRLDCFPIYHVITQPYGNKEVASPAKAMERIIDDAIALFPGARDTADVRAVCREAIRGAFAQLIERPEVVQKHDARAVAYPPGQGEAHDGADAQPSTGTDPF
jgi:hypothetical protein